MARQLRGRHGGGQSAVVQSCGVQLGRFHRLVQCAIRGTSTGGRGWLAQKELPVFARVGFKKSSSGPPGRRGAGGGAPAGRGSLAAGGGHLRAASPLTARPRPAPLRGRGVRGGQSAGAAVAGWLLLLLPPPAGASCALLLPVLCCQAAAAPAPRSPAAPGDRCEPLRPGGSTRGAAAGRSPPPLPGAGLLRPRSLLRRRGGADTSGAAAPPAAGGAAGRGGRQGAPPAATSAAAGSVVAALPFPPPGGHYLMARPCRGGGAERRPATGPLPRDGLGQPRTRMPRRAGEVVAVRSCPSAAAGSAARHCSHRSRDAHNRPGLLWEAERARMITEIKQQKILKGNICYECAIYREKSQVQVLFHSFWWCPATGQGAMAIN
ncbi:uncharacterized protein LOC141728866 [Zonotrichia albicollis]|uniref:uncharacterized protein LOC141728866 n=1 Tax=Zonotrichia albicollis TaxID=44394 RepID=UPI003D80C8C5